MQLTAELFRRIVSTLHSDEGNCTRHEKRKEGRVGLSCLAEVTPRIFSDDGQKTISVRVRDISPSGMGFITHSRLAFGLELVCSLPREGDTPVEVIMTVRHCTRLSAYLFNAGVSFHKSAFEKPKVVKSKDDQITETKAVAVAV